MKTAGLYDGRERERWGEKGEKTNEKRERKKVKETIIFSIFYAEM
jgi:hypothetical protein